MLAELDGLSRRGIIGTASALLAIRPARAEAPRLRIARQFGMGYAQLALMEDRKLIEKYAANAGLGAIEVTWSTFRSSDVMSGALLSGELDIASLGVPGLATIWDRTAGARYEVKGLVGLNIAPLTLVTRDPAIQSLADYRPGMKIALPAVKVSNQAIFLQMEAAKLWGMEAYARLDPLTISMAHPDAVVAVLSGLSGITSYFGSPPFTQRVMKSPGVHEVLNSSQILGGAPASFNILGTPRRFYEDNPRLVKAFLDALGEATEIVNRDKVDAAATYGRLSGDKSPLAELAEVMTNGITYTLDMQGTLPVVQFMASVGILKHRPQAWTDYMFPSAAAYAGS